MANHDPIAISKELFEYRKKFDQHDFQQGPTIPLSSIVLKLKQMPDQNGGFSVIRLGDGEGACLFWGETEFENLRRYVLAKTLTLHFGDQRYSDKDFEFFFSIMQRSTSSADILTFSRNERVHKDIVSAAKVEARGYVGSTYANYYISGLQDKKPLNTYHDGYLHVAMLPHYANILKDRDVSIVSCFTESENKRLANRLRFNLVNSIMIPGQFVNDPQSMGNPLYPYSHFHVMENITRSARSGMIFLIAAGLLGKLYCIEAAQNGSVAIDVGSVMDVWHGKGVRPYQHAEFVEKHRI